MEWFVVEIKVCRRNCLLGFPSPLNPMIASSPSSQHPCFLFPMSEHYRRASPGDYSPEYNSRVRRRSQRDERFDRVEDSRRGEASRSQYREQYRYSSSSGDARRGRDDRRDRSEREGFSGRREVERRSHTSTSAPASIRAPLKPVLLEEALSSPATAPTPSSASASLLDNGEGTLDYLCVIEKVRQILSRMGFLAALRDSLGQRTRDDIEPAFCELRVHADNLMLLLRSVPIVLKTYTTDLTARFKDVDLQRDVTALCLESLKEGSHMFPSGAMYTGMFLNDKFHGQGTYVYADGSSYNGRWEADRRHGYGVLTSAEELYKGLFKDDEKHGSALARYANGTVFRGEFKRDVKSLGVMHGYNGDRYHGCFDKGRISGTGVMVYDNGKMYGGMWNAAEEPDGHGAMVSTSGVYVGDVREGRQSSVNLRSAFLSRFGNLFIGDFIADKLDWGYVLLSDGTEYVGSLANWMPDGFGASRYVSGNMYIGMWTRNMRSGEGMLYNIDGSVFFGTFLNGAKMSGLHKSSGGDWVKYSPVS